jgi:tetraacyldisaccharide 4'-kinase
MYKPSPFLAPLLLLPGILNETGVRLRNALYDFGRITPSRVEAPVLSIGNLTLGGSGKTPLAIHVAEMLQKSGATSALLSRGYGRTSSARPLVLAPGERLDAPDRWLGDEPALVRRRLPSLWLGISANRLAAAQEILRRCRNPVFLLDDGFQHRRFHRDLDIIVLDRTQNLLRGRIFPRGILREPISGISRADVVMIHETSGADCREDLERVVQGLAPAAKIFHCTQPVESLMPYEEWLSGRSLPPDRIASACFLVAAIGNPARFESAVRNREIRVVGRRFFRDHYRMGTSDWRSCAAEAAHLGAEAIIITEKDAIKMADRPDFPVLVAIQKTVVEDQGEFEKLLRRTLEKTHA